MFSNKTSYKMGVNIKNAVGAVLENGAGEIYFKVRYGTFCCYMFTAFILRQTVSLTLCKSSDDCIVPMSV